MVDSNEPFIPEHGTEQAAVRSQSFGGWAQDYQRYRPGYPPALFDQLLARLPGDKTIPAVVDIGAGTGQLSRGFVAAGCSVTAVEPDDRMREVLADSSDVVQALAGSAEQIPVADQSADIVAGGQMWHWVDESRALPEVARVLRPGGLLGIVWTFRDDRVDWVARMHEIAGLPDSYSYFRDSEVPSFGPPFVGGELLDIPFLWPAAPTDLVGLVGTFSHVGTGDRTDEILQQVRDLAESHPQLAGQDSIMIPYVCKAYLVTRE